MKTITKYVVHISYAHGDHYTGIKNDVTEVMDSFKLHLENPDGEKVRKCDDYKLLETDVETMTFDEDLWVNFTDDSWMQVTKHDIKIE